MKKVLFALCLMLLPCPVFADDWNSSMRCKSDVVSKGATTLEVLKKCGEPVTKDTVVESGGVYRDHGGYYRDQVEYMDWTYNFGPYDFIYVFRFKGGTLLGIKRGGRGF